MKIAVKRCGLFSIINTSHGRKSVVPPAAGVVLGDLAATTFSPLGLGPIMFASADLFSLFQMRGK
jgi:threonine/homoserine/homoserine lactone efflux protein